MFIREIGRVNDVVMIYFLWGYKCETAKKQILRILQYQFNQFEMSKYSEI
jgi:hypothetical protein